MMTHLRRLPTLLAAAFIAMTMADTEAARAADPENTIYMELEHGRVVIELLPGLAPNHVRRIKELSREGFYDGLKFHRVIDGFMVQTGDPRGDGTGGSDRPDLAAEFSAESHVRGVASMARARDPDSANSQFFIVLADSAFLDRKYTVWGRVTSGMEFVDRIRKGDRARNGMVDRPDAIVTMRVAADVDGR